MHFKMLLLWSFRKYLETYSTSRRRAEEQFAPRNRMLLALAMLPAGNVIEEFEELVEIRVLYDDVPNELSQYFETTCRYRVSVDTVGMHQDALHFLLSTCGTCSAEPMMNYCAPTIAQGEDWHRSFQGHISGCHPLFWKFSSVLQKEENMIRISIVQHLAGHLAPPPRQHYLEYIQIDKGFSTWGQLLII